jgi:hypothetical protein
MGNWAVPVKHRRHDSASGRLVTVGVGAVLAALGVAESRRLSRSDESEARGRARQLGLIRVAVASALLIRPTVLPRLLGMPTSGVTATWLPRLFGVRELVVGLGAVIASRPRRDPLPALLVVSAVDAAEALVLLAAILQRELPWDRAAAFVLADIGSAAALPVILTRLRGGTR